MMLQRMGATMAQMTAAGLLAIAVLTGAGHGLAHERSWKTQTMPAPDLGQAAAGGRLTLPSPSLTVHDPQLLLDGPRARDMLMVRIYPRRLTAAEKARWQQGLQEIMERLDDEGRSTWQDLGNYRHLLANYLLKRRCRTESYVRLRSMWAQMVAMHDMLLMTTGEDALRAVVAEASADADARPCS